MMMLVGISYNKNRAKLQLIEYLVEYSFVVPAASPARFANTTVSDKYFFHPAN